MTFRAAELRTTKGRDRAAALAAWRAYLARFGPARDAHAQMIPLLEQMGIRTLREAREAAERTYYARIKY